MKIAPERPVRRTVTELFTLYKLEPSFKHVFCEGRMDRGLLSHFVRATGLSATVHRLDDYVDVAELLEIAQDSTGVRARLIMLAEAHNKRFQDQGLSNSLTCVVDRDSSPVPELPELLSTDYSDIELYTWEVARLTKLLELGYGADVTDSVVDTLMLFVERRALRLCLARRLVHERGEGLPPPTNVTRFACPRKGDMDLTGFIKGFGGSVAKDADALATEIELRAEETPRAGCRLHMNGHDVIILTVTAIERLLSVTTNVKELQRTWFSCLDAADLLESEEMFKKLRDRLSE